MKKADSEWLLLMGAEDVIEPYALFYMASYLQDQVQIDFVFADSDLLDDKWFAICTAIQTNLGRWFNISSRLLPASCNDERQNC